MNFKQFLEFYVQQEQGDFESIIRQYQKNIGILLSKDIILWRGAKHEHFRKDAKYPYIELSTGERRSRTGSNLVMHASSKWNVPSRAKSVFATSDEGTSSMFGSVYMLIPRDDVKQFAYKKSDMNTLRDGDQKELRKFLTIIYYLGRNILRVLVASEIPETRNKLLDYIDEFNLRELYFKDASGNWQHAHKEMNTEMADRFYRAIDFMRTSKHFRGILRDERNKADSSQDLHDEFATLDQILSDAKIQTATEYLKSFTAEKMGVKTYASLREIDFTDETADELWFEGHYLLVNTFEQKIPASASARTILRDWSSK